MIRKEDTAYLGRNLFLQGQKYLKGMKVTNPSSKITKIEATRMLMKQKAKSKKGRPQKGSVDMSDYSDGSPTILSNQTLNMTLDVSMAESHRTAVSKSKEKEKDSRVATMIKNSSFENVLTAQKRQAAWQSFAHHWALGFKNNDDLITTKKKTKVKKSAKVKNFNAP